MARLQFQVLYREFLFRLVDREALSLQAEGDASRLYGRFAAFLVIFSLPFSASLPASDGHALRETVLIAAWGAEHALIATTMLVVGLFAVLSWDSAFPDRRDVLVLAPLPVRAPTIFFAKAAALGAALSVTVITFNAIPSFACLWALAPPSTSLFDLLTTPAFYRTFIAYWLTVFAAAAFLLFCVLAIQGMVAQLPRRLFLRVSAVLQLAAFCLFLSGYFLEPSLTSPAALAAAENRTLLAWLPSYWFLALFQELNGSLPGAMRSVLLVLADRAWIGLGVSLLAACLAFLFSYFRTLRKIVEQPDILPGSRQLSWLPRFGNSLTTAVAQFSIRTLFRSRQHRVIVAFYPGAGFALAILFLRTPLARKLSGDSADWHRVSVPMLASSFVMMCLWALGIRAVFAMPLALRANWIFRVTQALAASKYVVASQRAMYVLALAPVWLVFAVLFLALWPWRAALGHLVVLGLLGIALIELCSYGFHKIPFACSYLPGKSNLHITFCLCLMAGLNLTYMLANFERSALSDKTKYGWLIGCLAMAALVCRWRTARENLNSEMQFEEELQPAIAGLGVRRDGILAIEPTLKT